MSDEADYVPDRNTVYSDLFVCYSTIKGNFIIKNKKLP